MIAGPILDLGCGTGSNGLYFGETGHSVTGVDVSTRAITQARTRTQKQDSNATFYVSDVLELDALLGTFQTILDSACFHHIAVNEREPYIRSLDRVLADGRRVLILAFSEEILDGRAEPSDDVGPLPTPTAPTDFTETFDDGWIVHEITDEQYKTQSGSVSAHFVSIERV